MLLKAWHFKSFIKLVCCLDARKVYIVHINLQITANETDDIDELKYCCYVFVCTLHYYMSIAAWIAGAMQVLIGLWIMLSSRSLFSG